MRFAVIGAGPAGAAAGWTLAQAGHEVVVYEAADGVGGRTRPWRTADAVVDSGAGFFTNFYPALEGLLDPLGLRDAVLPMSRTNVLVHDGRAVPLALGSSRSFLSFPFVSLGGKLRMARRTGLAAVRHRATELGLPETLAALDDRSVTDEALATLGAEVYEFFVRPGVEPFWYFRCEDVSRALFLALQARAATARFFTLRDGMGSIAERLVGGLEVRLSTPVASVTRAADGVAVDGQPFDGAVVATTATVAARIVAADLLPGPLGSFLSSQEYVANVHASFRVPADACPDESARFPAGPGVHPVAAVSFNSHKGQGPHTAGELVSVFLGAAESSPLVGRPDEEVAAHAWQLARGLCPELPADAQLFGVVAREEAIPIHAVGRYRLASACWAAQRPPLAVAGDHLATATVDGALRSGQRAAAILLA